MQTMVEPIVETDEKKYEKVKDQLIRLGYWETDFLEGGPLYGWSTNELIDLARNKKDD